MLQALAGLRASDESPRRRPGLEPEEIAYIEERIAEIKARIGEGGVREAAIRALVYIGLAAGALDERRFAVLRQIRDERGGDMTLEEFKRVVREQFFSLLLDPKEALAAIPKMLPEDPAVRKEYLDALRRIVTASGKPEGLRAERLAEIEGMFARGA